MLATLSDYERLTIADALVQEEFPRGAVICLQGEPGNKFYIIEKARACSLSLNHLSSPPLSSFPPSPLFTLHPRMQRCTVLRGTFIDAVLLLRVFGAL